MVLVWGVTTGWAGFSDAFIKKFQDSEAEDRDKFAKQLAKSAQIQGVVAGDLRYIDIPAGARVTSITVYSFPKSIEGLRLTYSNGQGQTIQSPLIGRNFGESKTVNIAPEDALLSFRFGWGKEKLQVLGIQVLKGAHNLSRLDEAKDEDMEMTVFGTEDDLDDHSGAFILPGQSLVTLASCVQPARGAITALGVLTSGWIDTEKPEWSCGDNGGKDGDVWGDAEYNSLDEMPYYMKYAGPWNEMHRPVGLKLTGNPEIDGEDNIRAGTYKIPRAVRLEFWNKGRQLRLLFTNAPELILNRRQDTGGRYVYRIGLFQAVIDETKTPPMLTVTVDDRPTMAENGVFTRAKLQQPGNRLVVDKLHFPEKNRPKDTWRGLFEQDSVVYGVGNSWMGYDGTQMNPQNPAQGQKKKLFAEPGDYDFYLSTLGSKAVPDGLIFRPRNSQSHYEYSERAISSEAELQKTISYNFGLSGGAKGASLGVNYSHQKSEGMRKSRNTMQAYGFGRILQHSLVLDRANTRLDETFARDLTKMVQGKVSASKIVDLYGTHYPNAITYGGLAVASTEFSQQAYAQWRGESTEISASGGAKGVSVSGGYGQSESAKTSNLVSFKSTDFKSIGGEGGTSMESFTPGSKPVPVLYDLRPLSELVNGFFLRDMPRDMEWSLQNARALLDAAIATRFDAFPPPDTRSNRPAIYKVSFHHLTCTDKGDESDLEVELGGTWKAGYSDASGGSEVVLWSNTDKETVRCNSQPHAQLDAEFTLFSDVDKINDMMIYFSWDLTEYDTPPFDPNDRIRNDPDTLLFRPPFGKGFKPQPHTLEVGGKDGQASLKISYTVQRIE